MFNRDNVLAGSAGYQSPESRSLTQVHSYVYCCHWLPKKLSNKGYQTYQRVECPLKHFWTSQISSYVTWKKKPIDKINQNSKQSLGYRWVMVGVVGNTSLLACWHWPNIGPTLKFQQLKHCCWPNIGPTTSHQRWILCSGANTYLPTVIEISFLTSVLF